MKLITEFTEQNIEFFTESVNGKKQYSIEGIFAQSEIQNRNGRIYPKNVMEAAVNKYVKEQVDQKRAVGELNHPDGPTINLDKVSHLITGLKFENNDVVGKATILNTPNGQIVKGLLDGGVRLGVSTRGMGSLVREGNRTLVKNDFILNTIDIVQDPSAHGAFVNGIMEGVEWIWDNGLLEKRAVKSIKSRLEYAKKNMSSDNYVNSQIKEWKNYLNAVK